MHTNRASKVTVKCSRRDYKSRCYNLLLSRFHYNLDLLLTVLKDNYPSLKSFVRVFAFKGVNLTSSNYFFNFLWFWYWGTNVYVFHILYFFIHSFLVFFFFFYWQCFPRKTRYWYFFSLPLLWSFQSHLLLPSFVP